MGTRKGGQTGTGTVNICGNGLWANPIAGLFDPKCFVARGDCPNENVTFWLYTNETRDAPFKLDALNINPWDFQPRRPVKILIHGYTGHRDFAPNTFIRPALLDLEDVYVISPDFGPLVRYPCYFAAVENLPLASKCLAQLINNLVDHSIVQNEDIHVIGFSLGAQVAGQTANYVKRKLRRITGLDPAKPLFITVGPERRLDSSDAEFVDVIHTDVLGRGMLHALGHADFYPNLAAYQPGCKDEPGDPGSCNHDRAPRYYAESINRQSEFWAHSCPSWVHYQFDLCVPKSNDAIMGYHVNVSVMGSFFLKTANASPYALGRLPETEFGQSKDLLYYNITDIAADTFEPQLRRTFIDVNERKISTPTEDESDEEETKSYEDEGHEGDEGDEEL